MSPRPPAVPTIAPRRAIALPASFTASGGLLALLLVVLVGCGSFGTANVNPADKVEPNVKNAILCSCDCDGAVENAVPSPNSIRIGADDATQTPAEATAVLTRQVLGLGQGARVGLRFQQVGLPPRAIIDAAYIQFTAAENDSGTTALEIRVVNAGDVDEFTATTDLGALAVTGLVHWAPLAWVAGERGNAQKSEDVKDLVQAIVNHDDYTPDSAIAFVITGFGPRRAARALEQAKSGAPAALTVAYTPRTITQEFLACGTPAEAVTVCEQRAQSNVADLARQCKIANTCRCKVATRPDTTSFAAVCNAPCPKLVAPDNCDPGGIAQSTAATANHTPVCVATSPLGSVLFGRVSTCEIDEATSSVSVRVFEGDDSVTEASPARGRVEFTGTPCPGGSCGVGMRHRMHMGNVTFEGSLFESDHTLTELSGVGASSLNALVNAAGAATFGAGSTKHSVRGREDGGETLGIFKAGDRPIDVAVGGWQPGGVCTMRGMVFQGPNVELFADIKGRLVNQPPTAVLAPAETVECNDTGVAAFALDPSARDPDNNVASFGWFRGSRTGPSVGTASTVELEQPVKTTTSYVFKVTDTFGQHAEATTAITVADTIAPTITAPPGLTVECAGHNGTSVALGTATATDICDASPAIGNNSTGTFGLGSTTVLWTATDASDNQGSATQVVTVVDTTPPQLAFQLSPAVLWSPNHKLEPITATITVTDVCDPNPTVRLVSITSSEADNGLGDGDQPEDIQGVEPGDDRQFLLRSERSGLNGGRVYTVTYEARDGSGNTTQATATVTVPKQQR